MAVEIRLSFNMPPQSSLRELQTYLERPASGLELRKDPEQRSIKFCHSYVKRTCGGSTAEFSRSIIDAT